MQQTRHAIVELPQDLGHVLVGGGRQRVEDGGHSRSGTAEDAIEDERVEMNRGIQGRTEPLDGGDGAALSVGDSFADRGATQPVEHAVDEHVQHRGGQRGVEGELIAQPEGQRQHSLAHGHLGEDAIHQLGGQFAHTAAPARGAEATPVAAERQDHFIAALLARTCTHPCSGRPQRR